MKCASTHIRKVWLFSFVILIVAGSVLQPWGVRLDFERPASAQTAMRPPIEGTVFAVTSGNNLISFNQFTPSALKSGPTAITGLQASEMVMGIDFRPRTGVLFAATNQGRIYTINTSTAAATVVGSAPFTVNGTSFGIDFNPVPDLIRFVTDADQNLRISPNDGTVVTTGGADGALAFATGDPNAAANPNVVASAYTNNFLGATTTTLYGIDSNLDTLVTQGSVGGSPTSPNTGQLFTVGSLTPAGGASINTTADVGFDIVGPTGLALASLTPMGGTTSSLYTINLTTGAATLIGPIGATETVRDIAAVARVETIFALTTTNGLLSFSASNPGMPSAVTAITGLNAGETLLGMDFRPANGLLYAVSNQSNVYIINTATGAATPVSAMPFTPTVNGMNFGVDFNPVPDLIRFVSDAGQNLRLRPTNGAAAGTDTNLTFATGDPNASATPKIVGAAYTNNFAGATMTTLYGIDSNLDILVTQGSVNGSPTSPNSGQLFTVGSLTPMGGAAVDTGDEAGFDIAPTTGAAFASLTIAGVPTLHRINLANGAATALGAIGSGLMIRDIAIRPIIERIFAVTNSNKLISFASTAPGVIQTTAQITGLQGSEMIVGLDFRPANGTLFAIGGSSRIYTINPVTGAATQVGTGATNPQLMGAGFGFDFNPVPDRIRIVSNSTNNLRFNPDTGASAVMGGGADTSVAYAPNDSGAGMTPVITGSAYDNSFVGSMSTTLYGIDTMRDVLVTQGSPGGMPASPNGGQLFTIGMLGVDASADNGFDIADLTNNAYAAFNVGGVPQLFTINLGTGAATMVGNIGPMGAETIRGIAVASNLTHASAQPMGMAVTNAASFAVDAVAPNSLAAVFGNFQTDGGVLRVVTSFPLPTTLGGVSVMVGGQPAQLLATSTGQLNILTPNIPVGQTLIMVTNSDSSVLGGRVNVVSLAPGIFSARSNGQGTAAAVWTTDGVNFQSVLNPDGTERPLPAGSATSPTFLILFTTGMSSATASAVSVSIGGANVTPTFAGPVPGLVGLEQINMVIPPSLAGGGSVPIRVTTGGRTTNAVTVRIQ